MTKNASLVRMGCHETTVLWQGGTLLFANVQREGKGNLPQTVEHWVAETNHALGVIRQGLLAAVQEGRPAHESERSLFRQLLELGGALFGSFLSLVGPGDLGDTLTLDDGHTVQRLPEPHRRRLRTVFGEFTLTRWV